MTKKAASTERRTRSSGSKPKAVAPQSKFTIAERLEILADIGRVSRMIDKPMLDWESKCHEIALDLVRVGLCVKAPYGMYHGHISPASIFAEKPFARHGWGILDEESMTIVDPTLWVFLAEQPSIAIIPKDDPRYGDYDLGASRFRGHVAGAEQPPKFVGQVQPVVTLADFKLDPAARKYVKQLMGCDKFDRLQLHWLAHRTPQELGAAAKAVYEGLARIDMRALIPIDYRNFVGIK